MNQNAGEPQKTASGLVKTISHIYDRLNTQEELLQELEVALQHILLPEVPMGVKSEDTEKASESSPLHMDLNRIENRICIINRHIRKVLERSEIVV